MQESIANILHHTRASEIRVAIARVGEGVTVSIDDNGQGFDVRQALGTAAGRGLHHQQRCAHAIGGRVDWHSGPMGTHFMPWLPLAR
ncbi:transmembrane sensor kinase vsrA transcription regulator protein [Ralstonia sp. NT80]|nr:transmembrane sensor kinase vsrA transcription regulator protein [Ralstonia sp. NT80]